MGKTFIAKVMKKKTRLIDRFGNVLEETETEEGLDDIKEKQRKRAAKLGLPFKG